ncbi:MAG: hypothetical protein BGO95_09910 [Micrococcales bacterium 73-13]|nr:MAG: hypothetical protein BGO95_09910 [Micrococcales bacterium 73-13]
MLVERITNAEGPVSLPDGRVLYTDTYRGLLNAWSAERGEHIYAKVGGYPNGATLGADGHVYVANNGGALGGLRSFDSSSGYIQRVVEGGVPETILTEVDGRPLSRPNDLSFGPEGLYFTDPGPWEPEHPDPGFIHLVHPDGRAETVVEAGPGYPNGVAVDAEGRLLWVESFSRRMRRMDRDGRIEDLHEFEPGSIPDGMAVAANGDVYVATLHSGGLHVVHADGSGAELLDLGGTVLTNCAFHGDELYLTDDGPERRNALGHSYWGSGRLLRLRLGVPGMPIHTGSARPAEPQEQGGGR